MKKFQLLLLDAGPILKLFELELWDKFIKRCDVTISQTVAKQAKWASQELKDVPINLGSYEEQNLITIFDADIATVQKFYSKFDQQYKAEIHPGEKETLAFLDESPENWLLCSADKAVFRVLGLLGKGEQGISLEEVLQEIGLPKQLEWEYSRKFREKYTRLGQEDFIQNKGFG